MSPKASLCHHVTFEAFLIWFHTGMKLSCSRSETGRSTSKSNSALTCTSILDFIFYLRMRQASVFLYVHTHICRGLSPQQNGIAVPAARIEETAKSGQWVNEMGAFSSLHAQVYEEPTRLSMRLDKHLSDYQMSGKRCSRTAPRA